MVDKYKVRDYIVDKLGTEYLIPSINIAEGGYGTTRMI